MVNDSADVTSSGRSFHVCGPTTGKARLPTIDSLLVCTTRRLVPTEGSDRRLGTVGRSATRVNGPRYPGASPLITLQNIREECTMLCASPAFSLMLPL